MPNRMIRSSICVSEKISKLTDFEFRLWVNLIVYVDDYGRGDARPAIIKGTCFPLRDEVTLDVIGSAVRQLAAHGCIRLYDVGDGKEYLCFENWDKYQRIRSKWSKFPAPLDAPQVAASCGELQQNAPENYKTRDENFKSRTIKRQQREASAPTLQLVADGQPSFDTLEVYAANNLQYLSPRNMEQLVSFRGELPEETIRWAIDEACAKGKRNFSYVRGILNNLLDEGIRTVGDAKTAQDARRKDKPPDAQDVNWIE